MEMQVNAFTVDVHESGWGYISKRFNSLVEQRIELSRVDELSDLIYALQRVHSHLMQERADDQRRRDRERKN